MNCFGGKKKTKLTFFIECLHLTLTLLLLLLPSRYGRQPGGERAPAHGHDRPAEQPEGAAPGGPRGAEEAGRLADGEAEAADGAGQAAAGPGKACRWRPHPHPYPSGILWGFFRVFFFFHIYVF